MSDALLRLENVSHSFGAGDNRVDALREVSISVLPGELLAVTGPSGSGKSTLLHIAGCLLRPSSGACLWEGTDLTSLSERARSRLRNKSFGFVFQNFGLVPRLTALQNVALPLVYAGAGMKERRERAKELLRRVGVEHRRHHFPSAMSGGEQQRVAIARSLVNRPRILFADEPTGNLDTATGSDILDLIGECVAGGMTVVMVTHEPQAAARASRIVRLQDSRVV